MAHTSCPAANAVVTDMAYNLGATKLYRFIEFREALKKEDWNKAA